MTEEEKGMDMVIWIDRTPTRNVYAIEKDGSPLLYMEPEKEGVDIEEVKQILKDFVELSCNGKKDMIE